MSPINLRSDDLFSNFGQGFQHLILFISLVIWGATQPIMTLKTSSVANQQKRSRDTQIDFKAKIKTIVC